MATKNYKVINPCKVNVGYTLQDHWVSVFCKIEYTDTGKLSISGVIGPKRDGDAYGGAGQIDMEFWHRNPEHNDKRYDNPIKPGELLFTDGWDADMWLTFLEYWHDWHLNDMRSCCQHQRALGWTYETHHGMWVDKPRKVVVIDEYDDGTANDPIKKWDEFRGHECPVCGYSCGSRWLFEPVPDAVIDFLDKLPHSHVAYAWV